MWVIVGLGNPGTRYSRTRHNIGFMVVERLSSIHGIPFEEKETYASGKGLLEGCRIILLKPLTFMNRSGVAVRKLLKKTSLPREEYGEKIIVIHDDIDIATGVIKIRRSGSSGGHRGVESVIQELGTKDFIRVKIGIGREEGTPAEQYVLRNFRPSEKTEIEGAIIKAADAVAVIVTEGIDRAMNRFNRAAKADAGGKDI